MRTWFPNVRLASFEILVKENIAGSVYILSKIFVCWSKLKEELTSLKMMQPSCLKESWYACKLQHVLFFFVYAYKLQLTCYSTGEKDDFIHVKDNFGPRDLDANLKKMISFMKNMFTYFPSVGSKRSQSHEPRDLEANLSPSEVSMRENNWTECSRVACKMSCINAHNNLTQKDELLVRF